MSPMYDLMIDDIVTYLKSINAKPKAVDVFILFNSSTYITTYHLFYTENEKLNKKLLGRKTNIGAFLTCIDEVMIANSIMEHFSDTEIK